MVIFLVLSIIFIVLVLKYVQVQRKKQEALQQIKRYRMSMKSQSSKPDDPASPKSSNEIQKETPRDIYQTDMMQKVSYYVDNRSIMSSNNTDLLSMRSDDGPNNNYVNTDDIIAEHLHDNQLAIKQVTVGINDSLIANNLAQNQIVIGNATKGIDNTLH